MRSTAHSVHRSFRASRARLLSTLRSLRAQRRCIGSTDTARIGGKRRAKRTDAPLPSEPMRALGMDSSPPENLLLPPVVAATHVALDGFSGALLRLAVATAARRAHLDPVAGRQEVSFALRQMRRSHYPIPLGDLNLVGRAWRAADKPRRAGSAVVHEEGGFPFSTQHPHPIANA